MVGFVIPDPNNIFTVFKGIRTTCPKCFFKKYKGAKAKNEIFGLFVWKKMGLIIGHVRSSDKQNPRTVRTGTGVISFNQLPL